METPEGGYTVKRRLKVFAGRSNQSLAKDICNSLSIDLGRMSYTKFSNCNIKVRIEESVREDDVFVVQSGYPDTNEALIELLIIIDALKYAAASRISISITARLVADLLETAGADRILTMDLHVPQIGGYSRIPLDQLLIQPTLCNYIEKKGLENYIIAAPDVGSAKRAESFARRLDVSMVILYKRRYRDDEKAKITRIIGEVDGKNCFIVDDEVSTGGTMVEACHVLKDAGAKNLYAGLTHGVLTNDACKRIEESPLNEFVTTNTIEQPDFSKFKKLKVLNVANLFSEAIAAIHMGTSVSKLFS